MIPGPRSYLQANWCVDVNHPIKLLRVSQCQGLVFRSNIIPINSDLTDNTLKHEVGLEELAPILDINDPRKRRFHQVAIDAFLRLSIDEVL